jgi:hypothetical protein
MKVSELISNFTIAMSNEEASVLESMKDKPLTPLHSFTQREQFVIETLIRKALVSKVVNNGTVLVMANEEYKP